MTLPPKIDAFLRHRLYVLLKNVDGTFMVVSPIKAEHHGRGRGGAETGEGDHRRDKYMNEKIVFEYEYFQKQEDVREHIKLCEGWHTQQAIYSTFHDALTQICFCCKKVRSTIKL